MHEEFRVCISCGYERGFHVSFRRNKGKAKIVLICPQCGQSYDLEWLTSSIKSFKAEPGIKY